ncbi:prepilin-type N-terminal cleavage/methylation domain-containing protein [Lachnospiraceae bacterium 62-35]
MRNNKGFSLLEVLIAVMIISIALGLFLITPSAVRRKEVSKYAHILKEEIEYAKALSMTREGQWQLTIFEEEDRIYVVQEKKSDGSWTRGFSPVFIGNKSDITYTKTWLGNALEEEEKSFTKNPEEDSTNAESGEEKPYRIYQFDRDTGECIIGSGVLEIKGRGKCIEIIVYEETGRCEIQLASSKGNGEKYGERRQQGDQSD